MRVLQDNRLKYKNVEWHQGAAPEKDLRGLTEYAANVYKTEMASTVYASVKLAGKNVDCFVYRWDTPQQAENAIRAHNTLLATTTAGEADGAQG